MLIFGFGYITCRTFYFVRSAGTSLSLLRASHIIYLSSLIKVMEHLSYAREIMREHMIKSEKNGSQISLFEIRFEEEINQFQERAIDVLLYCHPPFFRQMMEFDDWESAMSFLDENKESALQFWRANT